MALSVSSYNVCRFHDFDTAVVRYGLLTDVLRLFAIAGIVKRAQDCCFRGVECLGQLVAAVRANHDYFFTDNSSHIRFFVINFAVCFALHNRSVPRYTMQNYKMLYFASSLLQRILALLYLFRITQIK